MNVILGKSEWIPPGKPSGGYPEQMAAFLPAVLEAAPDAMLVASEGVISFANSRLESMFGYGADSLAGVQLEHLVAPRQRDRDTLSRIGFESRPQARMGTGLDIDGLRANGSEFPVEISWSTLEIDGQALFIAALRDFTERKRTEDMLRETRVRLMTAAEIAHLGYAEMELGSRRVFLCPEFKRQLGFADEELPDALSEMSQRLHPEDRERVEQEMQTLTGAPTAGADLEYRLRHKDGSYRWIKARWQVFSDQQGVPQRLVGVHLDVTGQRRILAELEESKVRLEVVLDSLKEAVIIFDPGARILDANPAALEILRIGKPGILHRKVREFAETFEFMALDGRILAIEEWPASRVLRGETFTDCELAARHKRCGTTIIASCNGVPVRNAAGEIILGIVTFADVSSRKQAERALRESERRLALALKASKSAVWEVEVATQRLLPADDLLFTMLGYAPGELARVEDWLAHIHAEDRPRIVHLLDDVVHGRRDGYYGEELRYRTHDGGWRWLLCQVVAAERDRNGDALRLVGTHTDISARKIAEEQAREAAQRDPLTGLPNRALVYEYGSRLLAAAQRSHGRVALLFIDLDRFKPINDLHGHEIGDRVLQEVAQRLAGCTRHEDLVGRLGGDEFVIILAHLDAGRHRAAIVAQKVIESICRPIWIDALELSISPSVGISFYSDHNGNVEALIRTADAAMYRAKQAGRGNYQIYSDEFDRQAGEAHLLEARLKHAIKYRGLALHYQPVVDVRSGRLIGAEALARLPEAGGQAPGPAAFIPIAESTGLIGELGEWVAAEACRQHEAWRKEGIDIPIAINVSPLQFRQRAFPERLGRIIAAAGIEPASIQVEVTESAIMEDVDEAVEILGRIKSLGVRVALDDFGTGYSSLSWLSRLPLDTLKVDRSFTHAIETDLVGRAITEAIIALGRNLKLEVIGEGIESEGAMHYLREHGCQRAQGYWLSAPLPACEFAQWYRKRNAECAA